MKTDVLYKRVYKVLRAGIANGTDLPGSRLPTEPELMETFQVSRVTARQALTMLKAEGLIVSLPAKGHVCRQDAPPGEGTDQETHRRADAQRGYGFFSKIIRGVEREAYARGFHVIVHATSDLVSIEHRLLQELYTDVAGFVIAAAALGVRDLSGYQSVSSHGVTLRFRRSCCAGTRRG